MSVLGTGKLRLTQEGLAAAMAAGWNVSCWVAFEGRTYVSLVHRRTSRVRTGLYVGSGS